MHCFFGFISHQFEYVKTIDTHRSVRQLVHRNSSFKSAQFTSTFYSFHCVYFIVLSVYCILLNYEVLYTKIYL